jgi:hypothetical protein
MSWPTLPGWAEAPTTATACGLKKLSSNRMHSSRGCPQISYLIRLTHAAAAAK